jgi:hypothetical protein
MKNYLFYFLVIISPVAGIALSTYFGNLKKLSNEYHGFSQGEISGTTTEKLTKVISWILYPHVLAVMLYLFSYYVLSITISVNSWLLVPAFWFELIFWFLMLGRIKLIAIQLFLIQSSASIGFAYIFLRRIFILGPNRIVPDDSDIVFQFWSVIFIYLILAGLKLSDTKELVDVRRNGYYKKKAKKFDEKFDEELGSVEAREMRNFILAILVKENFERPKIIRIFEKFKGKTTGIAQFEGKHNDKESIVLCIAKILELKAQYDKENHEGEYNPWYQTVAMGYNHDWTYAEDITNIFYDILTIDFRKSDIESLKGSRNDYK